jgi:HK97 family phage prohead protease
MPLPKPKKGETREAFIARCMASEAAKEFPTDKDGKNQRLAVCEKQYDEKDKQKSVLSMAPQKHEGTFQITELVTRAADDTGTDTLPAGCCARMTGVALVYEVRDDYGTVFARGCLAQTVAEKVRPGKVRLFADHEPRTKTHVGTVIDIKDVGDQAIMTAVIFDTEAGRRMKEYLEAVTKSGKETGAATGLSVGFRSREDESTTIEDDEGIEQWACRFLEIELREISVTPVNAVPGSDVLAVRREPGEKDVGLLTRILARILSEVPESEARAVFDTAYASAADRADHVAAPSGVTPPAQATADAATGSESSTASAEPKVLPLDERMRIVREVLGKGTAAAAT